MAPQRPRSQDLGRRALLLVAGGAFCLASEQAWLAPSRRAAAAAVVAGFAQPALAQGGSVFGDFDGIKAGPAGDIGPGADVKTYADSPEVVAKRNAWREQETKRQDQVYQQFRGIFADFAKDGTDVDTRVELLEKMKEITLKEKMLPIGITREDVVKGIRAVKFNEGCIKDKVKKIPECKKLEKGYQRFLAAIDKVYDRSLVTAR
ncbi:unnamed protein product [Effrenium voratum]|uniref:Uncharacterized protein n=1 Tax=Effrenium voratum TaxID=2562239 RepID=A0AA36JRA4_9DINO|nr:unnamed protein product [Effrenium voratum]